MIRYKKPVRVGKPQLEITNHKGSSPLVSPSIAVTGAPVNGASPAPQDLPVMAVGGGGGGHRVLLQGVDTLSITAGGIQASTWLMEQSQIWNEYQQSYQSPDDFICIEFDNKWWELYPYGRKPYKYQLRNNEVGMISIWNTDKWEGANVGKQHIHIHFYSKFLHSFTTDTLEAEILRIVSQLFNTNTAITIQVSRADLHSDVSSVKMLGMKDVENSISRCKFRDYFYEGREEFNKDDVFSLTPLTNNKGGQKLIDNKLADKLFNMLHNQVEYGCDRVLMKRDLETAYWGNKSTGSIWGKVYNKTKQVKVKNDDDTPLLWIENGWNGKDEVVRVEFSMRRDFLKTMDDGKYVSLQSFLSNVDIVWKYLTEKWLRLVEDVKQNNSTWSIITPFWKCVTGAFKEVGKTIIRVKSYKAKVNQLWLQGIGCIKQMISIGMVNNEEEYFMRNVIKAVSNDLQSSHHQQQYLHRRMKLGIA